MRIHPSLPQYQGSLVCLFCLALNPIALSPFWSCTFPSPAILNPMKMYFNPSIYIPRGYCYSQSTGNQSNISLPSNINSIYLTWWMEAQFPVSMECLQTKNKQNESRPTQCNITSPTHCAIENHKVMSSSAITYVVILSERFMAGTTERVKFFTP